MSKKLKQLLRTIKLGTSNRAASFDAATVDQENRTVELSFSSEEPYERYWGVEILGHNPEEVDLARMNNGGAFCMDHNTRDQVGVVEKAWIGQDRKGRALVRFGKSARASEIFQDVLDGIRRNVSVSYDIIKMALIKSEIIPGSTNAIETYRVNRWTPLEISLVSVPADTTVGVGRDHSETLREIPIENTLQEERKNMKKCNICGAEYEGEHCPVCARAKEAAERSAEKKTADEKTRVTEIMAMGKKHGLVEDAARFISESKPVAEFKDFVIEKVTTTGNVDTGARSAATAPDAPIYQGSKANALGQQLLDIRTMTRPDNFRASEITASRSRLEQNARRNEARAAGTGGFNIGVPAEGGFVLQGETAIELMTTGFNNSEVLKRCSARTLAAGTQFVEIVGIDETSRATGSRGGGVRVYTTAELDALTQSKTAFKKIRIEPKKLTGMYYASGEMVNNATFLGQEMRQMFSEEFAFKCQDLAINGLGAGEVQGVLAAGCTVSQAKESGQVAKTVLSKNLSKMYSRLMGKNPVWLINRDVSPELDELSIVAGTAALEPRFVTYGPDGLMRIKGAPVIEIEQCATLGTVGDIILADFSQYITANKGDINEAMSIHVNFIYDQETYRFIYYFDGQPRWASAITPYKGSNTVSPFVTLASRA